ncbi:glucans biosynthesis glucosyltransferase MdoH [Cereibacter sphaeroides]|uniref:glucans biosynthesis glucosyltransferase MdoH n=1 Tax=Cereibacter sphaeroides TaxID=1063 RepID=UPI001F21CBFD|nr:glucans biosynthesis glucosyltransferase MdoH [Cereibacter sphaeroides]MCE6961842.1 glucans biosynthesis glucosyltransferase MdoH [Cereibacter sphaeroides]MCE6970617.1 glucans biosynthesis glucosyltransferase MdoH [Cereibacter sphaeroides]MCE6975787.1 glucans biosynthesis glucosyltransferase MdoH [Cereibacter sphaeroides]
MPAVRRLRAVTLASRLLAAAISLLASAGAFFLFLQFGSTDGLDSMDITRSVLILVSTSWLAWGAAHAVLGLFTRARRPANVRPNAPIAAKTVILVPVYNEDPVATFSRIAAMDASLAATPWHDLFHFAILSDTRDETIAARERFWFLRLLREREAEGRIFYRRRPVNKGRKAGNIEDFIQKSGAAYELAVILDADSLMEGETLVEMVRRMEAEPRLGLLQTLPAVTKAKARFGRSMQFSAALHAPIFARGLAMMQGETGPFWGHNAIVRVRAFAESCGLPELSGPPPFGGPVMSHDYVEAALLARSGWTVRFDDDIGGSYEEGPENLVDHAKRDRRWCQGNLQHGRILFAPGLRAWNRFVFVQGIMAYIAPLFWLGFILASIAAPFFAPPLDYFPVPYWPFPVFPSDETWKAIGLAVGIFGLLLLPKLLIAFEAILTGRAAGFGGAFRVLVSTLAELAFSSIIAPILMAFQTRSVLQVVLGRDGGWPTNNRGDGSLTLAEAWMASHWIVTWGLVGIGATYYLAPGLVPWLLPVAIPMILSPLVIMSTSKRSRSALFTTPLDMAPTPVLLAHDAILADWQNSQAPEEGMALAVQHA